MLLLSLVIMFFISICVSVYTYRIKNIFNPLSLFIYPLFLQYLIYYFIYKEIYDISNDTIIIYLLGIFSFLLGYIFFSLFINKKEKNLYSHNFEKNKEKTNRIFVALCLFLGIVSILFTKLYLNGINSSVSYYDRNSLNLREAFIDNAQDAPFYVIYGKYFLLFSVLIYWYDFVNKKNNVNKWFMILIMGLLFYNSFSVFSRTDLLITIVPILIIYIQNLKLPEISKKNRTTLFKILALSFVLIGLFTVMSKQRRVNERSGFFTPQNPTMQYLGRPLPAFEQWVVKKENQDNSFNTVEPIGKVLSVLGGEKYRPIKLAPRGQFNVYTYLRVPYMENGKIGVLITMIIVGFLCNFLFYKYKTRSKYWVIFYSVYAYAIIMSFFAWQFGAITYLYLWIFLLCSSIFDTVFLTKNKYDKTV